MPANDQPMPDIAFHLDQLGEKTTAAELVRKQGQSRKLKVISEKKLMDWILALLQQQLAGKADAFSDEEKQALVAKAQDELQKRLKLQQEVEAERSKRQAHDAQTMANLENSKKSQSDYERAIQAMKERLEQSEHTNEDLRQDIEDLNDQLGEKMALLSTTIDEKNRDRERAQDTLRNQVMRASGLVNGVLTLDNDYYAGRHQEENPVDENATDDDTFFHDYDIGAAIIDTLSKDLERLRGITQGAGQKSQKGDQLLESDLALLAELKAGSLSAIDVAQPVAGLVAAVDGACAEATALEDATADALGGMGQHQNVPLTAVPDPDGKPADVIAGTTAVVRELGSLLARERQRLGALKSMADEADEARHANEAEMESLRKAYDDLLKGIEQKASAEHIPTAGPLSKAQAAPAERSSAALEVLDRMRGQSGPAEAALIEQIQALDRALSRSGYKAQLGAMPAIGDQQAIVERLRATTAALENRLAEQHTQIAAAVADQNQLASQLRDLGKTVFDDGSKPSGATASFSAGVTKVHELDHALAKSAKAEGEQAEVVASSRNLIEALRKDAAKREDKLKAARVEGERLRAEAEGLRERADRVERELADARTRAQSLSRNEREMSDELMRAAQGDNALADLAADLAMTLENAGEDEAHQLDISAHTKAAVAQLAKRKRALADELAKLRQELETARASSGARTQGLEQEIARLTGEQAGMGKQLATLRDEAADASARYAEVVAERDEMAASGKEVIQQLREQIGHRNQELQGLRDEEARLRAKVDELQGQVVSAQAATRALAETVASLLQLDPAAAKGDAQVAAARTSLEQAMTQLPGDDDVPLRADVAQQLAAAGQELIAGLNQRADTANRELESRTGRLKSVESERATLTGQLDQAQRQLAEVRDHLQQVEAERDEMAASGKEIITQLTGQRDTVKKEIGELRRSEEQLRGKLDEVALRLEQSESSNRSLAEALSAIAASESQLAPDLVATSGIDESRVDLELALSELPDEGETDVVVPVDLSPRLAEAGRRVADALTSRRAEMTEALARSQRAVDSVNRDIARLGEELSTVKATLAEKDNGLKRVQAEAAATKAELKEVSAALAAKSTALGDARSELASLQSAHDTGATALREQEASLKQTTADLAKARNELAELGRQQQQATARAAAAEQAHAQLGRALQGLAAWNDEPEVRRIIADQSSPLAKAAAKLQAASEGKNPEVLAGAGQQFVQGLRERLKELVADLAKSRERAAEVEGNQEKLQTELSSQKAAMVSREHDLEAARAEAAQLLARADEAERASRSLAIALADAAGGADEQTKPLIKTLKAKGKSVAELAAAGGELAGSLAARGEQERGDRERQGKELARLESDRSGIANQLSLATTRLAEMDRELADANARERELTDSAANLSRELLLAAKAMVTDEDPAHAERIAQSLAGFDHKSPAARVAEAVEAMPAVREKFTNLAIDMAELRAKAQTDAELGARELADLRRELEAGRKHLDQAKGDFARLQDEHAQSLAQALQSKQANDALTASLKQLEEQLLQATAELDEYRARGSESTGAMSTEVGRLQQDLAAEQQARERLERELAAAKERLGANEAKLRRGKEELEKLLGERDKQIAERDRQLDEINARHTDTKSLEAKLAATEKELSGALDRLREFEQTYGQHAGVAVQAGDLAKQLKSAKTERDGLRDKLRELEAELADSRGSTDELGASLEERRKELQLLRDKHAQELAQEREKTSALRDDARKLKEEVVGLRARVRRLSEHG